MHDVPFSEDCVKLYICELALALDYLQEMHVVHRDIKPDNILLDEEGHAHLTDFNIATVLEEGHLATSMSGTKPYMAPEIFDCAADLCVGYGFPVDWWSLGVCAYECARGVRPFDIHSATNVSDVRALFAAGVYYPSWMSRPFVDLLSRLLCARPGARISSLSELKKVPLMADVDFDAVLHKKIKPTFTPPKDHLNCDPTHELEEMIIEQRPLHKKKKRLAKQRSIREVGNPPRDAHAHGMPAAEAPAPALLLPNFVPFNREREMARKERELKEQAWEQELLQAMGESGAPGADGEGAPGATRQPSVRPPSSTATPPPTPATPATPNSGTPPGSAGLTVSSTASCSRRVSRRSASDAEDEGRLGSGGGRPTRLSSSGSHGSHGGTRTGSGRSGGGRGGSRGNSPNIMAPLPAATAPLAPAPPSPGDVFRSTEEEAAAAAAAQDDQDDDGLGGSRLLLGREHLEQCLTHIAGFSSDLACIGGPHDPGDAPLAAAAAPPQPLSTASLPPNTSPSHPSLPPDLGQLRISSAPPPQPSTVTALDATSGRKNGTAAGAATVQ
ncbi:hypothetical protein ONE63_009909 [Megalurothrips usitatus]|uniref:Protein kinase domain-containing protein n=1 Tax=Megalurothrips usitatus TaxID=439358 RepID=A0AAV7XJN3_9NEOP|nr:hypothetical protein ONE63_009909 [Megalurothrips usitatus]